LISKWLRLYQANDKLLLMNYGQEMKIIGGKDTAFQGIIRSDGPTGVIEEGFDGNHDIPLPDPIARPKEYKKASEKLMKAMEEGLISQMTVHVDLRTPQDDAFLKKKREKEIENRQKL